MTVIRHSGSNNEAWVDMTDAEKWAYVRRLEDAVTDAVKELGTLRQQRKRAVGDFARVTELAQAIVRDCRESDKVLAYAHEIALRSNIGGQ